MQLTLHVRRPPLSLLSSYRPRYVTVKRNHLPLMPHASGWEAFHDEDEDEPPQPNERSKPRKSQGTTTHTNPPSAPLQIKRVIGTRQEMQDPPRPARSPLFPSPASSPPSPPTQPESHGLQRPDVKNNVNAKPPPPPTKLFSDSDPLIESYSQSNLYISVLDASAPTTTTTSSPLSPTTTTTSSPPSPSSPLPPSQVPLTSFNHLAKRPYWYSLNLRKNMVKRGVNLPSPIQSHVSTL